MKQVKQAPKPSATLWFAKGTALALWSLKTGRAIMDVICTSATRCDKKVHAFAVTPVTIQGAMDGYLLHWNDIEEVTFSFDRDFVNGKEFAVEVLRTQEVQ